MKRLLFATCLLFGGTITAQDHSRTNTIGTNNSDSLAGAVLNESNGEYAVFGKMGWNSFNANPQGSQPYDVIGDDNNFLGVYNPDGTVKWAFCPTYSSETLPGMSKDPALNGTGSTSVKSQLPVNYNIWNDAAFQSNGKIVVVGAVEWSAYDFDPIGGSQMVVYPFGWSDIIMAIYDTQGNLEWLHHTGDNQNYATSVAVDQNDDFIVGGFHDGTAIDFDQGFSGVFPVGSVDFGGFVTKYDFEGEVQWSFALGSGYSDVVNAIATDASNNIIVGGTYGQSMPLELNPMGTTYPVFINGGLDTYLAKYDENGIIQWGFLLGDGANDDEIYSVATDPNGDIYVAGRCGQTVDFDPLGAGMVMTGSANENGFLAKYDENGQLLWVNMYEGTGINKATNVEYSNNEVVVTGSFQNSLDLDPSGAGNVVNAVGGTDGFVVRVDRSTGEAIAGWSIGSPQNLSAQGAFNNSIAGTFQVFGSGRSQIYSDPNQATSPQASGGAQGKFYEAVYCYPINLTHSASTDACENDPAFQIAGASLTGGDYSGVGVINNQFYPSLTGVGSFPLTYDYTSPYGCSAQTNTTINVVALPNVVLGVVPNACENDDLVQLSGGLPAGGTYSGNGISNGMIDPQAAGNGPHLVTYEYTDPGTGCTNTDYTTFSIFEVPDINVSVTDANCATADGAASVAVTGGTAPYTYYWSNGVANPVNNGIESGQYMITVTDGNGCEDFAIATVSDINGPQVTINSITNVVCFGDTTGAVDISIAGGTAPYTYDWSNGDEVEDLINVAQGTYEFTVTDASNCQAVVSVDVNSTGQIVGNETLTLPSCGASDGGIQLNTAGGTAPYTYDWNTGATTSSISAIPMGLYSVEVTDANGCIGMLDIALSENGGPTVDLLSTVSSPCGQTIGAASVNVTGAGPFTYNWAQGGSSVASTMNLSNAAYGTYEMTATDNNGCSSVMEVEIDPEFPDMSICLVTVDTATGTNLVVWEKPAVAYVDGFNVYRESSVSGDYQLIRYVDYDSLSQITDSVANPLVRSWRYKIAAVDLCGNESTLSPKHKTIHLTNAYGIGGQINLSWDSYEGFPYSTYDIWRWSDQDGYNLIQSLPSNLNSFTDLYPPAGAQSIYYFIEVIPPSVCTSTRAVSHNTTRSNRTQSVAGPSPASIGEQDVFAVSVYPQPNDGQFVLEVNTGTNADVMVEAFSVDGKLVHSENMSVSAGSNRKDIGLNVEAGMYQLVITKGEDRFTQKVMILK